jgi:hypothetical protein
MTLVGLRNWRQLSEFEGEWPSILPEGLIGSDMRWPIRDLVGFKATGTSACVLSAGSRYAS